VSLAGVRTVPDAWQSANALITGSKRQAFSQADDGVLLTQ
jgi:hypothetical protein